MQMLTTLTEAERTLIWPSSGEWSSMDKFNVYAHRASEAVKMWGKLPLWVMILPVFQRSCLQLEKKNVCSLPPFPISSTLVYGLFPVPQVSPIHLDGVELQYLTQGRVFVGEKSFFFFLTSDSPFKCYENKENLL